MDPIEPPISHSEDRMLRAINGREAFAGTLDWVVLQHLKQKGLVEESLTGPKITDKGKQAISRP